MLKRSLLAISLLCALTGCSLDGDDGLTGPQGGQGAAGVDGQNGVDGGDGANGENGQDANRLLDINLVGRAVLNAQSPEGAAEIVAYQASKK